jgi:hypothetical protein
MRKNLQISQSRSLPGSFCLLAILFASSLRAQASETCEVKDYKVLSPSAFAIRCAEKVTGNIPATGTIYLHGDIKYTPLNAKISISQFEAAHYWLLLGLSDSEGKLEPNRKYTLLLTYPPTDSSGHSNPTATVSVEIDTSETMTIASKNIQSQPTEYKAVGHIAFATHDKRLEFRQGTAPPADPCQIYFHDYTNKMASVDGKCATLVSLPTDTPTLAELAKLDPDLVGVYDITLDSVPKVILIPAPLQLRNIFGNTPKIDPKSRFTPLKAPATKDAAEYYINFNYAAGVGTVPAWVLDGKISPQIADWHRFSMGPLATANVGNNKLKGQTYTNTIDLGATAQRIFQPNEILQELLVSPGATYETDKNFDRDNLLATFDLRYNFANMYHTQSIGTLQRSNSLLQQAEEQKKLNPKVNIYIPQLDDVKPVLLGYALDFHTGIETGGALVDTTVKASSGPATLVLPTYPIFRFVPQIHGLLEIWKFSFDATMKGWYLATTEYTAGETASHALFLQPVHGWKGLGSVTILYNLDTQGHFALNIAYKDGFAPPTYQRVNAVQAGIVLKY